MEIRTLEQRDQAAFRTFNDLLYTEKKTNPFIETVKVTDFEAYQAKLRQQETSVQSLERSTVTTYFAFIGDEIAGKLSCRWELDKGNLSTIGGHIGYVTSPKYRRQGVAKALLQFARQAYRERGIDRLFITALENNRPSRATIESVGGVLQDIVEVLELATTDGMPQRLARYWVDLKPSTTDD